MLHEFWRTAKSTGARLFQSAGSGKQYTIKERGDSQNPSNNCTRSTKDGVGIYIYWQQSGEDIRCDKMRKRLSRIRVYNKNGRDFIIEEGTGKALCAMMDVNTPRGFSRTTLHKITLKVSNTILMSIDLNGPQSTRNAYNSTCQKDIQFFHP